MKHAIFFSFFISWLSGMLVILISAFYSYDQFSIIDITSFAVMTFISFLLTFIVIYLIVLKSINKRNITNQSIYYPVIFSLPANLPVYFLIWINKGNYYGQGEATLFTIGFLTSGFAFGLFWAWKNKIVKKEQTH
jgi:hypothetical protein